MAATIWEYNQKHEYRSKGADYCCFDNNICTSIPPISVALRMYRRGYLVGLADNGILFILFNSVI